MIRLETLGDSFERHESGLRITGRRNGQMFALGDAVRVKVEDVSVARRRIDFSLVQDAVARPKRATDAPKAPAAAAPRRRRRR
jgi:ribonuclease R